MSDDNSYPKWPEPRNQEEALGFAVGVILLIWAACKDVPRPPFNDTAKPPVIEQTDTR